MLAEHGCMRDGAEHAPIKMLRDGAALVCVAVRCHDWVSQELLGEGTGQPVLLCQKLDLHPTHLAQSACSITISTAGVPLWRDIKHEDYVEPLANHL